MKESYVKGLANHNDPESCGGAREGDGEALTGESAGRVLSRESSRTRDADSVEAGGRQQPVGRHGKAQWYPARSKTPGMYGSNDDFVVGFEHQQDAEQFHHELAERFAKFKLKLHPEKARVIEFGRGAAKQRQARGQGKPESFNFLGFTHSCSQTRKGKFTVLRRTMSKRKRAKLKEIKMELRQRLHYPVPEVGRWLRLVVAGHNRYYGVPANLRSLSAFRFHVGRVWYRTLRRRSQKTRLSWERMRRLMNLWLPRPALHHPYPSWRIGVST